MTTYSIHLDDLDVALLPIERYGCNNFLKKELFEFQVLAKEAPDPPVTTNHTCHICAIDVPAAFWSAHSAGAKHHANARIAIAAAKRMSALVTATPPPHIPHVTEQFCDSCTCMADKDHEKTQEHKLSVFQDKMLWDLVMIYAGDDVNNDQKENEKKNKKDLKDAMYQDCFNKVDEDIAKADLDEVNLNGDQSTIVEHGTDIPNQDKTENVSNICKAKMITPRYIESYVVNNKVLKAAVNKEIGNTTAKQTNVNHQDTSKSLEEHKLSVFQDRPLCDLVTIYTSDDNIDQKEKKKNKKKKDAKDPMEQENSQEVNEDTEKTDLDLVKLNSSQTPKVKNVTNIQNQNKTHNIADDNSEPKKNMPSYAEVMSNKNEKNKTSDTATKLDPQDVSKQNNGLDLNEFQYPFVKELTEVRCLVCDCITPPDLHNRVIHAMGRRHIANVSKLGAM